MNLRRNISILAFAVLLIHRAASASDTNANPYPAVAGRNVFGLQPPPPMPAADPAAAVPKIKLTGIMSVFGRNFALLKTDTPKEKNYLLAEGQRDDEIKLESVDAKAGTVAMDNHGVAQTLTLPKPPAGQKAENGNQKAELAANADGNPPQMAMNNSPGLPPNGIENGEPASAQIMPAGYAVAGAVNSGSSNSSGNDSSTSGNPNSADNNSGSQNSGGGSSAAAKPPEPWWMVASKNVEASRIATASLVESGQAEPYPLTPFTPSGTPAALIGPGQLYFVPSAMNN